MRFKITKKKNIILATLICAAMIVSATFGVLVSNAIFSDKKTYSTDLTFTNIELNGTEAQSTTAQINLQLVNQQLLAKDITFSKASTSANIYVRASVKFATDSAGGSVVAKDVLKFQSFSPSTAPSGYTWVQWGEYYYLMDSATPTSLKALTNTNTFTFLNKESLIVPQNVIGNYNLNNPVNISIALEAIAQSGVATPTIAGTTALFSNTPTTNHTIVVKNSSGTTLHTYTSQNYGTNLALESGDVLTNANAATTFSLNTKADGTGANIPFTNTNGTYYINNISQDLTLYQVVSNNTYSISATKTGNGTVSPSYSVVNYGDDVNISLTPETGYGVSSLLDNGVESKANIVNNIYTLSNVSENHTISVVFIQTFTVNFYQYEGGSLLSSQTIEQGSNATAPSYGTRTGYTWQGWNTTFTNITANKDVYGTWTVQTFTITASAGANGTISPSGTISLNYGASQTFTITPNSGYQIATLTVDGSAIPAAVGSEVAYSHTISNVQENKNVVVTFKISDVRSDIILGISRVSGTTWTKYYRDNATSSTMKTTGLDWNVAIPGSTSTATNGDPAATAALTSYASYVDPYSVYGTTAGTGAGTLQTCTMPVYRNINIVNIDTSGNIKAALGYNAGATFTYISGANPTTVTLTDEFSWTPSTYDVYTLFPTHYVRRFVATATANGYVSGSEYIEISEKPFNVSTAGAVSATTTATNAGDAACVEKYFRATFEASDTATGTGQTTITAASATTGTARYRSLADRGSVYTSFQQHTSTMNYHNNGSRTTESVVPYGTQTAIDRYAYTRTSKYTFEDWRQFDFEALYLVKYADYDSQKKVGYGVADGSYTAVTTAYANAMFGRDGYITDSTLISTATANGKAPVWCLGISNAWGNTYKYNAGMVYDYVSNTIFRISFDVATYKTYGNPGTYTATGSSYVATTSTTVAELTTYKLSDQTGKNQLVSLQNSSLDYFFVFSYSTYAYVPIRGGYYDYTTDGGAFHANYGSFNGSDSDYSVRLIYAPN